MEFVPIGSSFPLFQVFILSKANCLRLLTVFLSVLLSSYSIFISDLLLAGVAKTRVERLLNSCPSQFVKNPS